MLIDRDQIAALIPHAGAMCLLDGVVHWDATHIACTASSHRAVDHPMRADGQLGTACAIEYAAQAMAVHGALSLHPGQRPRAGLLVGVRETALAATPLDAVAGDLAIEAEQLSGGAGGVIYRFEVRGDGQTLASGRATVILDIDGAKA